MKGNQFNEYFEKNMENLRKELESNNRQIDPKQFLRDDAVQILLSPPKSTSPLVIANPPTQHYD